MGHTLNPIAGDLPPLNAIVERLEQEFLYVRVDRQIALEEASARADWIERANPQLFLGRHDLALAQAARLRTATLEDVLWIEFGDDRSNVRHFLLLPDESINFAYSGSDDEDLARPILLRCARALECKLVLF
jgi:hypothetical protein